jgi:hypothetical protein
MHYALKGRGPNHATYGNRSPGLILLEHSMFQTQATRAGNAGVWRGISPVRFDPNLLRFKLNVFRVLLSIATGVGWTAVRPFHSEFGVAFYRSEMVDFKRPRRAWGEVVDGGVFDVAAQHTQIARGIDAPAVFFEASPQPLPCGCFMKIAHGCSSVSVVPRDGLGLNVERPCSIGVAVGSQAIAG